jgi:hypothetical protein
MGLSPAALLVDEDGNIVGVTLDGGVYRLEGIQKVRNASGTLVNPATQETLESIKDTDGIKKITEALPAGTNELGKVAQGTKATLSEAWPTVPTDADGNELPVDCSETFTYGQKRALLVAGLEPTTGPGNDLQLRKARMLRMQLEGKVPYVSVRDQKQSAILEQMLETLQRIEAFLAGFNTEV